MSDVYKEKIMSVKCGFKHTICLTSGRRLYAWGRNRNGQLGTGNLIDQLIPIPISLNVFPIENLEPKDITLGEMIADYNITDDDVVILSRILYPNVENRVSDYQMVIEICEKKIRELEK